MGVAPSATKSQSSSGQMVTVKTSSAVKVSVNPLLPWSHAVEFVGKVLCWRDSWEREGRSVDPRRNGRLRDVRDRARGGGEALVNKRLKVDR